MNRHVCDFMRQQLNSRGDNHYFSGSIIMIAKNDRGLDLYNGDTGILLMDQQSQQLRAVFPTPDGYRTLSIHVLPPFHSAFAMTIHKSQGSEFNRVLIPLPNDPKHKLLSREVLYTGLTRAKKFALIYAEEKCLKTAIERRTLRHSGLNFWT